MADVVVTVPKSFGLDTWIAEGQLPGEPWNGLEYHFYLGGQPPEIEPGERVYICYHGSIRGYAPLVRIEHYGPHTGLHAIDRPPGWRGYALVRHGDAVALTIDQFVRGFRGFRYRWWSYEDEIPFPHWYDPIDHPSWPNPNPIPAPGGR